jgi:transposase
MSLKLQAIGKIPEQTVKVASVAFPDGNTYMKMRDELGVFFDDDQFVNLFSSRGQPALSPWRLALVTVMQYAENLTDRQAADAVRARIDWKYALGLELTDPGFNYSVLSEFRDRLIEGSSEQLILEKMLSCFTEKGLLKARGKQRTDSTHILAAIKTLNRLELVAETMIHTLNVLATVAPEWLKGWVPQEWFNRYERRLDEYRLPQEKKERTFFAETIGGDGYLLLKMIYSESDPEWLRSIPAKNNRRLAHSLGLRL